jgi:nucleoside phosphorylase
MSSGRSEETRELGKFLINPEHNRTDCSSLSTIILRQRVAVMDAWQNGKRQEVNATVVIHSHTTVLYLGMLLSRTDETMEQLGLETGALWVEMEAAGLMIDFPCIIILGVCDYADTHMHKQFQEYAALAAASYARAAKLCTYGPCVASGFGGRCVS